MGQCENEANIIRVRQVRSLALTLLTVLLGRPLYEKAKYTDSNYLLLEKGDIEGLMKIHRPPTQSLREIFCFLLGRCLVPQGWGTVDAEGIKLVIERVFKKEQEEQEQADLETTEGSQDEDEESPAGCSKKQVEEDVDLKAKHADFPFTQ